MWLLKTIKASDAFDADQTPLCSKDQWVYLVKLASWGVSLRAETFYSDQQGCGLLLSRSQHLDRIVHCVPALYSVDFHWKQFFKGSEKERYSKSRIYVNCPGSASSWENDVAALPRCCTWTTFPFQCHPKENQTLVLSVVKINPKTKQHSFYETNGPQEREAWIFLVIFLFLIRCREPE